MTSLRQIKSRGGVPAPSVVVAALVLLSGSALAEWDVSPRLKVGFEERYDDDALYQPELPEGAPGQLMSKLTPQLGVSAATHTFESDGWYAADFLLRHGSGRFTVDSSGGADAQAGHVGAPEARREGVPVARVGSHLAASAGPCARAQPGGVCEGRGRRSVRLPPR